MLCRHHQKGVTLTELSISIAIISMLIAGTFSGMAMLQAAKIRRVVSEFTTYKTALEEFSKEYDYNPGDMPTASSFWSGAGNGDGDGYIEDASNEDLYAWQHLSKAKLISGSYSGAVKDGSNKYGISVNAPNSDAYSASLYSVFMQSSQVYGTRGHVIRFASLVTGGLTQGGVMVAKDAYAIDAKIDDGLAASGMLYATRYNSSGCVSADSNAATATYSLDNTTASCNLWYWQQKF